MKIRSGFVSNSSSSSFIALIEPESFKELKESLNDLEKEVLEKLETDKVKLSGKNYIQFYSYVGEDWVGFEYDELSYIAEEDEDSWVLMEKVDTAINSIRQKINKLAISGVAWSYEKNS